MPSANQPAHASPHGPDGRAGLEPALACAGIWGGFRDLDQDVTAGPLLASVFSSSADGGKGGDIYYVGVCTGDALVRVAIADVVGHGSAVSAISEVVYGVLQARMCRPDSARILEEINERAHRLGLKAMTTAAVVSYDLAREEFHISYAGHPPFLFTRAGEPGWSVATPVPCDDAATDLPLAVAPNTKYSERTLPARSGDRLMVYTDGVIEAPATGGEMFGLRRLRDALDAGGDASLPGLRQAVLRAVRDHVAGEMTHDDVTLIGLEVR
ncbi:MAG: PP2C family protein-serine/threonine phosphatase [Planctomycetota bacterium]|jgi:sigma-B regulation protein RsbU (phosphoserine phosphatase)